MADRLVDNVARLLGESKPAAAAAEISLDVGSSTLATAPPPACPPVELQAGPKVWFVFGRGRSGKSTLLKWQIGRAAAHDGLENIVLIDMDRKSFKIMYPIAEIPPPGNAMGWLERILSQIMKHKVSAAVDFGGDMTLLPLLARVPNIAEKMIEAGVEPVAFYLIGPSQIDLTALNLMEAAGFKPKATLLMLNMGMMKTKDPVGEFAAVRNHSVYRRALERGATEAWMPPLEEAPLLDEHLLGFWDATNNLAPNGVLDHLQKYAVSHWLGSMERISEPWASWHLP